MSILFTVKNKKFTRKSRNAFLLCVNAAIFSTELLPWQAESGAPMENVVTCRSLASSSRPSSPRAGEVWSLDPLMVAVSRYEGSLRLILIQSLSQVHHLALL